MLTLVGEIISRREYIFLINAFRARPEKSVKFSQRSFVEQSAAEPQMPKNFPLFTEWSQLVIVEWKLISVKR